MTNLSLPDREHLSQRVEFASAQIVANQLSSDGTRKLLLTWPGGAQAETVMIPDSDRRTLQARAIAAAAIICLQAANEEWVRLGGQTDMFDLYDTAVQAIRRPT
jgi:adenine C2-methylase RlmN of 23S rRNA A2503 and tRNA A37